MAYVGTGGANAGWSANPQYLKAWEGIVIKLNAPNTLYFNVADRPHLNIVNQPLAKLVENVDDSKKWTANIIATRMDNSISDKENYFGVNGMIAPLLCEPPMVGNTVSLSFNSEEGQITHDLRTDTEDNYYWEFKVETPDAGASVKLTFENIEKIENGYLVDKTSRTAYKLKELKEMNIKTAQGGSEYRIIVGSKEFAEQNNLGVSLMPKTFTLFQNYPNPFNPITKIRYNLPEKSYVKLVVYDILGRQVATLLNGEFSAGYKDVEWRANVSSGMYLYRIEVRSLENPNNRFVETKKMVFMK